MRTAMILMTLTSAGAGYLYLQRTPPVGDLLRDVVTTQRLNDMSGRPARAEAHATINNATTNRLDQGPAKTSKGDTTGTSTKNPANRVHQNTKSILDDFASLHGGHSDAPSEDAFQRLKQATQSFVRTASNGSEMSSREVQGDIDAGLPQAKLSALQPIAFDRDDDVVSQLDPSGDSISSRKHDVQVVASNLAATAKSSERDMIRSAEKKALKLEPTSNVKRTSAVSSTDSVKPASEWKVIGKTTEGRKIHSMHLGNNGVRTLVIAGLDGQDRVAVRWLEEMAQELASRPDLIENNEVTFFRAGNPDGLVHQYKGNARGVPLNRNFPSRRYRQPFGLPQFAVPASEVETRVMLDTLYSFRPRRVIHLSSTSGRSQVVFNRISKPVATELERSAKITLFPFDSEQNPGSIEDFADGTLEAAVLSVKVNPGRSWQQTWTGLQPHILAAVIGRPIDSEQPKLNLPQDQDQTRIPSTSVEPISRNPRRRGYEELPAPPGY